MGRKLDDRTSEVFNQGISLLFYVLMFLYFKCESLGNKGLETLTFSV